MMRWILALVTACCFAGLARGATLPPIDQEFDLGPSSQYLAPMDICLGPDGNLWFTMNGAPKIGRITPQGVITKFPTNGNLAGSTYGICAGPDGNMWFTENSANRVGRMTTDGVVLNEYIIASVGPRRILAGIDGSLFFTESTARRLGRLTATGSWTEYGTGAGTPNPPFEYLCLGADGNVWASHDAIDTIEKIDLGSLAATQYPLSNNGIISRPIAAGIDGKLWIADPTANKLIKLDVSGNAAAPIPWPTGSSAFTSMIVGPDWNLWGCPNSNRIDVISGAPLALVSSLSTVYPVTSLCRGPDASVWMTEYSAGYGSRIGRTNANVMPLPTQPTRLRISGSFSPPRYFSWSAGSKQALSQALDTLTQPQSRVHRTRVSCWDGIDQRFVEIDGSTRGRVHLGDGLYITSEFDMDVPVTLGAVESAPYSVTLRAGWNLIGIPALADGPGPIHTTHPLAEFTLYDANSSVMRGIGRSAAIGTVAYRWDGTGYQPVTALETGQAYWLRNANPQAMRLVRVNTATGGMLILGAEERGEATGVDLRPPRLPEQDERSPVTSCGGGSALGIFSAIALLGMRLCRRRL